MVFNFDKTKDSLSGPVAIVAVGAEVARSDVAGLFQFAAILNINLAVINILPLPVPFCGPFTSCPVINTCSHGRVPSSPSDIPQFCSRVGELFFACAGPCVILAKW